MFNNNSRLRNVVFSSAFGVIEQIVFYIVSFIYRTVFIYVLSQSYLGITGLFTNVLQVFSLAELGIGTVISYRLYAPVKEKNIKKCAAYICFFKHVYLVIALVVFIISICFYPFLFDVIKNTNEIPMDVNLRTIYWLFVFQSVFSYLFVYWQSILNADQKNYILSIGNVISNVFNNVIRITLLLLFSNYTLVVIVGVVLDLFYNIAVSIYIKSKYRLIAIEKNNLLDRQEKIQIFKDTGALMCHRIGFIVANATDSIILSKYVGISVLGMYSNYSLIMAALDKIMNKLLGNFVSTIGNLSLDINGCELKKKYYDLLFVNLWLASLCAICFYVLVNPFIELWVGETYLLNTTVIAVLSLYIFLNSSRIINSVFVNATGMFVKDKARPLIEAALNLFLSIYFVREIGLAGVFLGSIASIVLTVWWREAIILYKNVFPGSPFEYYSYYIKWLFLTCFLGELAFETLNYLEVSIFMWLLKLGLVFVGVNSIYIVLFRNTNEFKECITVLEKISKNIRKVTL